ncbi:MAG: hypothetical protein IKJ65_11815 [Clostridia bacterium]|nr:hypothetical protein [Clostridia bacterium]
MEGLTYAYSYRFSETPVFEQEDDCIVNRKNPLQEQGFDNITLLTKEKCLPGTKITTVCSFDRFGAPLITIAESLTLDENGKMRYGDYLEVVVYKNGVNVWRMYFKDGKVTWDCLLCVEFSLEEMKKHTLSAQILKNKLVICANERKMILHIENMYPSFHVGVNACEEINRFYSMEIREGNEE